MRSRVLHLVSLQLRAQSPPLHQSPPLLLHTDSTQ
jgi:hypothetical protein